MIRTGIGLGAVVLLLFAAVTMVKRQPPAGNTPQADTLSASERARTHRFWEVYRQATAHRLAGRYAEAAGAYREALALDGTHEDALYYLGSAHVALGKYREAEAAWRRLIEINPTSARAYAQLGDLFFCYEDTLLDLDAAQAAFERALAVNKEETGPLLHLGEIALLRGDHATAQHYLDAVVVSNYRSVEAHFLRGYLAWSNGDLARALDRFGEAVRHAEPEAPVQGVLGEGDTKSGHAMTRRVSACRVFEEHLAGLDGTPVTEAEAEARYRRLGGALAATKRSSGGGR